MNNRVIHFETLCDHSTVFYTYFKYLKLRIRNIEMKSYDLHDVLTILKYTFELLFRQLELLTKSKDNICYHNQIYKKFKYICYIPPKKAKNVS